MDGEMIIMGLLQSNLYGSNFTKVHKTDVVNLAQSSKKNGALEL